MNTTQNLTQAIATRNASSDRAAAIERRLSDEAGTTIPLLGTDAEIAEWFASIDPTGELAAARRELQAAQRALDNLLADEDLLDEEGPWS